MVVRAGRVAYRAGMTACHPVDFPGTCALDVFREDRATLGCEQVL